MKILRITLALFIMLQTIGQTAWAGPHPADADGNFLMTLNESTAYGFCWRSAPATPAGCPTGSLIATLDNAVRAGTLWNSTGDGSYHYDSTKTCPLCWLPGAG